MFSILIGYCFANKPDSRSPSDAVLPEPNATSVPSSRHLNYSALKKAHQKRVVPELREEDIEEAFVRGKHRYTYIFDVNLHSVAHRKRSCRF